MSVLGQVYKSTDGLHRSIKILHELGAENTAPLGSEGVEAGVALRQLFPGARPADLVSSSIKIYSTGANVTSFSARVWVFDEFAALWAPLGVGDGSTSGLLNEGNLITAVATNKVRYTQPIDLLSHYSGVFLQIASLTGSAPAIDAYLSIAT